MNKLLILIVFFSFAKTQDFNQGPYGINYFDTAGPFEVNDLNLNVGDVDLNQTVDILDLFLAIDFILGNLSLDIEQEIQSDCNLDNIIDIADIINISKIILGGDALWNFEYQWNGEETYIFITIGIPTSLSLWYSTSLESLLLNSPSNVHYFFISDRSTYSDDIINKKEEVDEILSNLSYEEQEHWKKYLHFVPNKCDTHDESFVEAICYKRSTAIDRFQKWREIGYLGNPATFSGTYIDYLSHEAIYFNYEWETIFEPDQNYDEIVVFEKEHYTGGWASTISRLVDFPASNQLNNYSEMSVELLRGCPDENMNYSDDGCDDYDRLAHMYICQGQCFEVINYDFDQDYCIDNGYSWNEESNLCYETNFLDDINQEDCPQEFWDFNRECDEISRWVTPFDRQPHHLTYISPFLALVQPGGTKMIKFQESGWPNSLLTLKIRLYENSDEAVNPKQYQHLWKGTVQFNPDYNENRPPIVFEVPDNAEKVEFVSYITGHGWGCAGCYNCAEFCNSRHIFTINGGTIEFQKDHESAGNNDYCMELETIAQGVIPNQYGTWGYGRAGWCPGMDVSPYTVDITNFVNIGEENVIDYSACRVAGASCVEAPTCPGDGCYCPEIPMSSYIIFSY